MKVRKLVSALLATTLFFSALISIYYYQKYQTLLADNVKSTAKEALHQLAYSEREYNNVQDQISSISDLLGHSQSLYDYLRDPSDKNLAILQEVWSSVAVNQKWYRQIRFLNLEGQENVRINYDFKTGIAAPAQVLQDKSERAYFQFAQNLSNDQIGSWGIELERENSELVYPYSPSIRIMMPVAMDGTREGYLVLNINVQYLSSRLNYSPVRDFNIELINQVGYYVASSHNDKLYGDIIPARSRFNFGLLHPKVWQNMGAEKMGYEYDGNHLVIFNTINFVPGESLHLIIDLSQEQLLERADRDIDDLLQEALFVLSLMLVFALPITTLALHYRRHSIESKLARAALDGMTAVMISDTSHRIMMVNQEFENMMGYSNSRLRGWNAQNLIFIPEDIENILAIWNQLGVEQVWEGEVRCRTKLNHVFTAIMRIQAIMAKSGKVSYYITSLVDISERKELEEKLRNLSEKDGLTSLWNRRKFEEQLAQYTNLVERYPNTPTTCLALFDIDHFKRINDELGHDEGDKVICTVAETLLRGVRSTDFVARVGGEEFAVIMPHTTTQEAEVVLNRLRVAVELSSDRSVTVSVGYSDVTADRTRSYKCADIALYESKSAGRNRVSICHSFDDIA
ncbi:sensor domain-containing diguanylate cyclase [Vibrio harveyi]|uniref:sensor domain-containing diguanylate cyclase n=1 Tax=Vibrio harveyi TaxID=669 RepID=UPI0005773A89|nr:diguanylate cyclase [Vibrio harveyi]EKO3799125.1 diguanylate cyclase [Vibrio harveyi]MBY7701518.1 diguanylate cyclase [Vibrio harveyi]PNM53247.1 diguanylate cyclase [Vibrio harveyi]UIL57523.1 sensor domain-containing diguanylate cyclase [Vibrio harveyi]SQA27957.1 diguanylate cyclase [Vibrio harveyi]